MPFPVDIRFVQRAEEKLGRKLPLGYVVRMCRDNGGAVHTQIDDFCLYPVFDDSDTTRLKRTCSDIVRETLSARRSPGFPSDAVAIGDNGGGDKLILLPDKTGDRLSDSIYWWDHETDEVTLVADDFADLAAR